MFRNNIWHFGRYCAYLLDDRTVHLHLSISMDNTYCNHENVNCIGCIHVWTMHLFYFFI